MTPDIRVLFVDDYLAYRDLTATMLEKVAPNIAVLTEGRPTAVENRLREESIDCVVSSYELPGMNGLQVCESVREEHPKLPFFLLTAYDVDEILDRALTKGVTDYVQKEAGVNHFKLLANRVVNAVEHNRLQDRVIELEAGA